MKPAIMAVLLLAPTLVLGQKFQDVTAKGAPVSLKVKLDLTDPEPYIAAHNNSLKGVLALVAGGKVPDASGQVVDWRARQDYVFKYGAIGSQQERGVMSFEGSEPSYKINGATGTVLFVQFEDGSTWGDPEAGRQMLQRRPQELAFLQHLVEIYYRDGDAAFAATLDDPSLGLPESSVAGCLKVDAEAEKIATIELAKKRLADAQEWRALGIF